jgi:ATP-dependent DNA helicase RecQ
MVSMPTGSGKSLLFQLAAREGRRQAPGACVIVITPTIALALDHARTLSTIPDLAESRALTSDTPPAEANAIVDRFRRGEVPILLLSPEKALNPLLVAQLAEAAAPHSVLHGLDARLTHLFVDEAHIVESWGRSFRPDFQRLPSLLSKLRLVNPTVRTVLLSATLPEAARRVLRQGWRFDGPWLEVEARAPRYELDVVVSPYDDASDRDDALLHTIDRAPRPAIVYTTEVDAAHALHDRLRDERGYSRIAVFTGGTAPRDRARIVEDWSKERLDLVIATSAFGLGVDKANVRSVLHACLPEGPARWYQEIGRASRDGGQGLAACLFTRAGKNNDVHVAFDLAVTGLLSRDLAELRWAALVRKASNVRWETDHQRMTLDLDAVREGLTPRSGDYNRGWNRALLTLLQRAKVVQVLSVATEGDQSGFTWDVEILEPGVFASNPTPVWDRIFRLRDEERTEGHAVLEPFADLMAHSDRACVTRTAFELIEPHAFAPPCGRCPSCRAQERAPPDHLACAGLERDWEAPCPTLVGLPAGVLLLEPKDADFDQGLARLLSRLNGAGIDQVVAQAALGDIVAQGLGDAKARLGLVMTAEDWRGEVVLARRHTAVILPQSDRLAAQILDSVQRQAARQPELTWLVVCRPQRLLNGRRLDQWLSTAAPLPEDLLDSLTTGAAT